MALKTFRLSATVSTPNPEAVRAPLERVLGPRARVEHTDDGLRIDVAAVVGVEARELNRRLLSGMRREDPSVKLRSEWTADGVTQRFRDYVFVKDRRG